MKIKYIISIAVLFIFLFVSTTADLSAVQAMENSKNDKTKTTQGFSMSINNADTELLQNDLILSNIDGGGQYYRHSLTWLWISLLVTVVVLVLIYVIWDPWYYWW